MKNLLDDLKPLLQKDERLTSEDKLLKNKAIELALKLDKNLLKLLLSDAKMKEVFFADIDGTPVFDKDKFLRFVSSKDFLSDSYTTFKNKIGLTVDGDYLSERKEVVLSWPYKDCVLEGGMTKEDQKRDEIFWNETLAPDEITRLLDPKVFTNAKRIDKNGEHPLCHSDPAERGKNLFRTDENGNIKDNLIIKGNNLLALHSLKKRFAGKIKLIYIDPPFNTSGAANTFSYNNSFNHSSWLTFMRNRLEVANDLLKKDGMIFISIDDNEIHYLRVLMDEIFSEKNYLNTFCWVSNLKGRQISGKGAAKTYEYILSYAKDINNIALFKMPVEKLKSLMPSSYKGFDYEAESDEFGGFVTKNELYNTNSTFNEETRPNLVFNIHYNFKTDEIKFSDVDENINFRGFVKIPPKKNNDRIHRYHAWRWNKEKILNEASNLKFVKTKNGAKIFTKIRKFEATNLKDIITDITTTRGTADIKSLFDGRKNFNYPKPVELIKIFVNQSGKEDIIMDFFSGSGTTAQAILELNKEDGGNRQFILCEQLDYVDTVTVPRVRKVIKKLGGGDFVYLELMKWNENFVDKIRKAKTKKELARLWETMKKKAFLSYKVDVKAFDDHAKGFADLSLANQKKFLLECLDKNHLYVNYSEIEDEDYDVSGEDKKLNYSFYNF